MAEKKKKTVLVVDDESDIRTVVKALIKGAGFDVETATNGEEALKMLEQKKYDLMILDILMPKMTGYDVMSNLSPKILEEMPVIMLTAKTSDQDILKGYSGGAAYYVTKPFDNKTLLNVVKYLIGDLPPQERAALETQL